MPAQNKTKQIIHFWARFFSALLIMWGGVSPIFAESSQIIPYEINGMNRYSKVAGQAIVYDGRGNMTDDGTVTYSYNMLNQQVSATVAGQTTQYLYDALGRRIGKTENGVTTRYIHDLRQQVLEEHRNGSLHARLTYGASIDAPLTLEQGGQTFHYHQDALGNVTELSNTSGAVVERYKYNVYGKASITDGSDNPLAGSAVGNEVLFNGRRYNPETNTYHYRARVYNPEWGQFLQRDSIDPGLLGSGPQGHNRYSYVANNPATFVDPSGHVPIAIPVIVIIGVMAGASAMFSQNAINNRNEPLPNWLTPRQGLSEMDRRFQEPMEIPPELQGPSFEPESRGLLRDLWDYTLDDFRRLVPPQELFDNPYIYTDPTVDPIDDSKGDTCSSDTSDIEEYINQKRIFENRIREVQDLVDQAETGAELRRLTKEQQRIAEEDAYFGAPFNMKWEARVAPYPHPDWIGRPMPNSKDDPVNYRRWQDAYPPE